MKKSNDPVLQEIYEARAELLSEHDGDIRKYVESTMKRQWESGHKIISILPKNGSNAHVAEPTPLYPTPDL